MPDVNEPADGFTNPASPGPQRPGVPRSLVNSVTDWLMRQALEDTDIGALVIGCCERLQAIGIPIVRAFFGFSILHPLNTAIGITWNRGKETRIDNYPHVPGGISDEFQRSPHYHMLNRGLDFMRVPLDCTRRHYDFPILKELIDNDMTDYFAFVAQFRPGQSGGMMGSWTTDHGAGFSDAEIDVFQRIHSSIAVATKLAIQRRLAQNLTETYLGKKTGDLVLNGQIKRGDGQSIRAAIWYADMRDSTAFADRMERQAYIDLLNGFFEATGGAVKSAGGEILSFIGDAILAIFPSDGNDAAACQNACVAAQDAQRRLDRWSGERAANGLSHVGYGIGVHQGEVMYGNVGVRDRLTFSAFGAAVNEIARIEALTKELGEPVLVSDAVANLVGQPWRSCGLHQLDGVGRRVRVFAPVWPDAAAEEISAVAS